MENMANSLWAYQRKKKMDDIAWMEVKKMKAVYGWER